MDVIRHILNPGWVSSAIGLISLLVALVIYRSSVVGARPTYQRRALRLIGGDEKALPQQVEIPYGGQPVDRLTKTYVVLWNSGKSLLRGSDVVPEDPLRCEFSQGSRILDARLVKTTRLANKFSLELSPDAPHKSILAFDYLDPLDGAVVEFLHMDANRFPRILGTIKGVPRGCQDWGRLRAFNSDSRFRLNRRGTLKALISVAIILGVAVATFGVVAPDPALRLVFDSKQPTSPSTYRLMLMVMGEMYIIPGLLLVWMTRRRFPKALQVPELDE